VVLLIKQEGTHPLTFRLRRHSAVGRSNSACGRSPTDSGMSPQAELLLTTDFFPIFFPINYALFLTQGLRLPLVILISLRLHFTRQWFVFPLRSCFLVHDLRHRIEWDLRCFGGTHFLRHLRVTAFLVFPDFLHFVMDGIGFIYYGVRNYGIFMWYSIIEDHKLVIHTYNCLLPKYVFELDLRMVLKHVLVD